MENTRGYRGERWGKGDGGGRNEKSWPHFCPLIFGLEPTRSLAFNNKLFTFNRGKHDRWTERAPGRKGRMDEKITGDETSGKKKVPRYH